MNNTPCVLGTPSTPINPRETLIAGFERVLSVEDRAKAFQNTVDKFELYAETELLREQYYLELMTLVRARYED